MQLQDPKLGRDLVEIVQLSSITSQFLLIIRQNFPFSFSTLIRRLVALRHVNGGAGVVHRLKKRDNGECNQLYLSETKNRVGLIITASDHCQALKFCTNEGGQNWQLKKKKGIRSSGEISSLPEIHER